MHRDAEPVEGPLVVAVGDIACAPGRRVTANTCQQAATARLTGRLHPRYVLTLGDHQYESGGWSAFESVYQRTWGRLLAITRPAIGNHEYRTPGAVDYFRYFHNQTRAPGYYAFNVDSWRVYVLNSNCTKVDCLREQRWLDANMAAHPRRCSLVTMHHPRYSSGLHGGSVAVTGFWAVMRRHHTDVALAAHQHTYERFRAMNARGRPDDRGVVSFVSGLGGRNWRPFAARHARGSVVRYNRSAGGVLALRLGEGRYAFRFATITGRTVDAGVGRCV